MPAPVRPPCVVVGSQLNALGVVRSLAADGVKAVSVSTSDGPAWHSRHATPARLRAMAGEELVEDLLALARRLGAGRPALIITDEQAMLTISALRRRLEDAYRFDLPDHRLVLDLNEKSRFQEVAGARGYPIPAAVTVASAADLAALDRLSFPCVVKPSCRNPAYEQAFAKAYEVPSAAKAAPLALAMLAVVSEVMVQEWIEGEDCDIHFCFVHMPGGGRADSAFVGRKIRINPPRIGATASCAAAPQAAGELTSLTERFFAELGYRGLGSMEYKRDRRSGRFFMVEPTVGRTDWQEEVATLNGVNLPVAAYRHLVGEPPPTATPLPSRPLVWCSLTAHLASGLSDDRRPAPLPARHAVADALWRLDDPMPALAEYPKILRKRLPGYARRILAAVAAAGGRAVTSTMPERGTE